MSEAKPWTAQVMRRKGLRQALALALLGAVSISAAFLLPPSRFTPAVPEDDALGLPFAGILKANRDYDIIDPETTQEKRESAARSVWPVYDFDAGAAGLLQLRLSDAFGETRAALETWKRANPRARKAEAFKFLFGRRDEFWKALQTVVEDEDYKKVAAASFDPALERAAMRLAQLAASGYVVAERELLAADRERGIVVRTLVNGVPAGTEQTVRDIDRIRDLSSARDEVDRLAAEQLADLRPAVRHAVAALVKRALRPNLAYDDAETRRRQDERRAQVKDVVLQVKRGEKIIGDGDQVTKAHLLIFHALRAAGRAGEPEQVRIGGGLFAAILCSALFEFGRRNVRKFRLRSRDVFLLATLLIMQLLLVRVSLWGADAAHDLIRDALGPRWGALVAQALPAMVPYALGSMLVRFLLHAEAAMLWTAAFAPLCGLLAGGALQPAVAALVGGIVAADRIGHAGSRSKVFRAGLFTGLSVAVVFGAFAMFQGRLFTWETLATIVGGVIGGGILLPVLTLLLAPILEALFGYVTDIELLKLASFNHPVLKDLIVQAPGTYHHGILIGQLVEAAAKQIGANPLLARVGAYYHDIGKGKNPLYFGENQKGDNRHDQLTPQMSAAIIKRHVAEGVELAVQAKLPRQVIDFIPQHHGTRVIGYFFHRAKQEAERTASPAPSEPEYRYAGPRPQTREAALVMIADMVVATSRNLPSATPTALRSLVDAAIQQIVSERQLDECEITLRDLEITARSFAASLEALVLPQGEAGVPAQRAPALRVLSDASDLRRAGN